VRPPQSSPARFGTDLRSDHVRHLIAGAKRRVGPVSRRERVDGADIVTLAAGELEASFAPRVGMAGVSLRHRGVELLDRRAGLAAYARSGAVMGLPLLYPWANRLDAHEYTVDRRRVRLPDGPPLVRREEHGLPIHGLLNASPLWKLRRAAEPAVLTAVLEFDAHPDLLAAFPFPHVLELEARLDPGGLQLTTTVRTTTDIAVPIAFGFHPYLRLPGTDRARWQLTLPARRHLAVDARRIPTGQAKWEPAESIALGSLAFDDGYDGLEPGARFTVADGHRTITLSLVAGYPAAQLFSPPGAQFICFEPMTAPTNALRSGMALRRVAPGEVFTAVFRIHVSRGESPRDATEPGMERSHGRGAATFACPCGAG
jgi:aldose 1-epimerase